MPTSSVLRSQERGVNGIGCAENLGMCCIATCVWLRCSVYVSLRCADVYGRWQNCSQLYRVTASPSSPQEAKIIETEVPSGRLCIDALPTGRPARRSMYRQCRSRILATGFLFPHRHRRQGTANKRLLDAIARSAESSLAWPARHIMQDVGRRALIGVPSEQ